MFTSQWQLKSPGQRPSRHHSTGCNPSNECLVKRARFPVEPSPCEPWSVRLDVFHLFPPITEFKVLIPKKNLQSASWSLKTEPIRFAKRSYCEVWVSSFCCDFVCAYYLRIWIYQRHILYIACISDTFVNPLSFILVFLPCTSCSLYNRLLWMPIVSFEIRCFRWRKENLGVFLKKRAAQRGQRIGMSQFSTNLWVLQCNTMLPIQFTSPI